MPGTAGGDLLKALESDKPNIKWSTIDPELQGRLNTLWGAYDTSRAPQATQKYLEQYAALTPQAQAISQGNLGFLNKYATQDFHPEDLYANLLGQNQQALGNFLMNPALADLTRQRKETQARLGRTGGAGIYDTLLQGRLQQQLAQQATPNLLGYTNQAFQTAGGLRNQDLLNRINLIGSGLQYNQLDNPALRSLEPQRIGRQNLLADLGNLSALQKEQDVNRAYYRKRGAFEKAGDALNAFQGGLVNEANQFADLYSRYAGLGGGMGGLGGLGGGAKTGASAPSSSPYSGYWGGGQWSNVPSSWRQQQTPYGYDNPYLYPGLS